MKAPKIPSGWRQLRTRSKVLPGDKIWWEDIITQRVRWVLIPYDCEGEPVYWWEVVIRRKEKK